jgi:CheY-like chemotaxis protein
MRRSGGRPGETILVVDDDPDVLETAVETLQELGYRTVAACDAASAMEQLRSDAAFDILFSDIVMPGAMDGIALAAEARRLRPELKILLTSGCMPLSLLAVPTELPVLSKPYMRAQLLAQLRTAPRG